MTPALHKIWCDEDEHYRYEHFVDFNEWLDSEEGQAVRAEYGVDELPQPSKALFSGDRSGYEEAFQTFRKDRRHEALSELYLQELCGDDHWFHRNVDHFIQLVDLMYAGAVVPFVAAQGHILYCDIAEAASPKETSHLTPHDHPLLSETRRQATRHRVNAA